MDSQKRKFKSQQKPRQYVSGKNRLNRKSTKAMSDRSDKQGRFRFDDNFQDCPEPPSPVSSSYEGSSVEVKYLSYLAQVIDSAPEGQSQNQINLHYQTAQYWHVVYQSAIYVRKDVYRTQIDDNLIVSEISQYLKPGRIHPQHSNEIGQQLLQNGYFLCAYAISTARNRKSAFIFRYLMQHFSKEYHLETNQQEFDDLIENYVHTDRVEEILHLNSSPNSHNYCKELTPRNQNLSAPNECLSPNRISYQEYLQEDSERSRTVIIDDESERSSNR